MDPKAAFLRKAGHYAKYRWDYSPQAVEHIIAISHIDSASIIADIGAGTGILTRHFTGRARTIYAVEPNPAMRHEAERLLSSCADCSVIDASAEATGLADHSIDLITAAQAVHWFDAEAARAEFLRVLKPGGWLAIIRNISRDDAVFAALREIDTPDYGVMSTHPAPSSHVPENYYFEGGTYQTLEFPIRSEQNLEQFIGAALSTSFTPDEDNPFYERFIQALRDIFNAHCPNGTRVVHGVSHLVIGQPRLTDEGIP